MYIGAPVIAAKEAAMYVGAQTVGGMCAAHAYALTKIPANDAAMDRHFLKGRQMST